MQNKNKTHQKNPQIYEPDKAAAWVKPEWLQVGDSGRWAPH